MSQFQDIDEFVKKSGNLSESEVELDTAANTVVLPQPISSRGNIASEKSAIRWEMFLMNLNFQKFLLIKKTVRSEINSCVLFINSKNIQMYLICVYDTWHV